MSKTFLVQALGASAVRGGHSMVFTRADHSYERVFRRYLTPDLLILDDFALHRLSAQQSEDLYDLIIERHRHASFALTSNRGVDEWLGLFDNPILGNSALDRLAKRRTPARDRRTQLSHQTRAQAPRCRRWRHARGGGRHTLNIHSAARIGMDMTLC